MQHLRIGIIAVALIAFAYVGINNIVNTNHQITLKEVQLESTQTELLQLQNKYDILNKELQQKSLDAKKVKQLEKEKNKLESERKRLEAELQAKANRKAVEAEKLARAAESTFGGVASAGSWAAQCQAWASKAGVPLDSYGLELIRRESTCNPNSVNPESGACGIGQDINGCSVGSDPVAQLKWMWNYVQGRYTTWQKAVAFHDSNNWY